MALVSMSDMLNHAYRNGYAVGAFDLVSLDFLEGIIAGAERCHAPVILSVAESHFSYFDVELLMPAVEKAARQTSVPVAIHLDHGASLESAIQGINLGCNGVMVDASHHSIEENIEATRAVVEMAHGCGVPVEGELGYVPGVEGEDAKRHPGEIAFTTPAQAQHYVAETGVDCLAVSIGTVHGRMQGEPNLDFDRLDQINAELQLPLVIHGGTGLSDTQFRRLIKRGVSKINYYTALSDAAAVKIHENTGLASSYTGLVDGIKSAITDEVSSCIHLWGSADRAGDVLAECSPWLPVEHLIIYNVQGIDDKGVTAMMEEGCKALSAIPGVLDVTCGSAIKQDAAYRFTWLIHFCHPAVIDSYLKHPLHIAFAKNHFRPVAGDRIIIDFQCVKMGS